MEKNDGGRLIPEYFTRELIERLSREIAASAKATSKAASIYSRFLKEPAKGIVHKSYPFGTVLRYPPTGDLAMVIGPSSVSQYVDTIALGIECNGSGYMPGDHMRIFATHIDKWVPET